MLVVYAIYNKKHDKFYIGQTQNLEERLRMHNNKTFKKGYTSRFDGYWELIYEEELPDRGFALTRERQLKSYRGRQYIKQFIPR